MSQGCNMQEQKLIMILKDNEGQTYRNFPHTVQNFQHRTTRKYLYHDMLCSLNKICRLFSTLQVRHLNRAHLTFFHFPYETAGV